MSSPQTPSPPTWTDAGSDAALHEGVLLRRVVAWLIDAILEAIAMAVLWVFCLFFGLLTLGLGWPLFGLLPLVPLLYQWLFLIGPMSATPGQWLLGLVVRRDEDLAPPSPMEALAFTVLFFLTLALGVIWMAVALFTVRHRTFHEIISGLVVIRSRELDLSLTPPARSWNIGDGGPNAA